VSRLIDDILEGGDNVAICKPSIDRQAAIDRQVIIDRIDKSHAIVGDVLMPLLQRELGTSSPVGGITKRLVACTPPFESTWVEVRSEASHFGVIMHRTQARDVNLEGRAPRNLVSPPDAKWMVEAMSFYKTTDGTIENTRSVIVFYLDSAGRICRREDSVAAWFRLCVADSWQDGPRDNCFALAAIFVCAFMGCRNVVQVAVDVPESIQKRRIRRGRHPLVRYHVLRVVSPRDVDRVPHNIIRGHEAGALPASVSSHICRGHFKTYTADRPLLGRYVGTFWWEAQARGDRSVGLVDKDYAVETK